MIKHNILLPSKRFFNAEESDLKIKIQFKSEQKPINQTDRSVFLDLSEQFDKERQISNKYRLTGTIKPLWANTAELVTRNSLILKQMFLNGDKIEEFINNSRTNTIENFNIFNISGWLPSNEMDFIRKDYIGSYDENIYKPFNIGDAHTQNWQLLITFNGGKVTTKEIKVLDGYMKKVLGIQDAFVFNIQDGLPYVCVENGMYYEFYCPMGHNLNDSDSVNLVGFKYNVDEIGNGDEGFDNKIFYINRSRVGQIPMMGTFKRVVDGVESEYYQRQNFVLKTYNEIDIMKNGFQSTIFEDESKLPKYYPTDVIGTDVNLDYNPDGKVITKENGQTYLWVLNDYVDVTNMVDHLDNPITELSLTIVFNNKMGLFEKQTTSFVCNTGFNQEDQTFVYADDLYNNNDDTITKDFNVYSDEYDVINGDICEYNLKELKEYVLQKRVNRLVHDNNKFDKPYKFTYDDEGNVNKDEKIDYNNYYYYPHNPIVLQVYSDYIEEAERDQIYGIPKSAKYDSLTNKWRWRDLYTKGFIDTNGNGVDYPYRNGTHYIHKEIFFYIKPDTIIGVTDEIDITPKKFLNDEC